MSRADDTDPTDAGRAGTIASSPGGEASAGAPPGPDPLVGQLVADRYHVLGLLGRGGMGAVYVCEHVQLKKRMALKVLAEDLRSRGELLRRFLQEARAAAQIGHPNIVDVYDLGELPSGGAYIAMALLEGHDLETELEKGGAVAVQRARLIVGEICRALAAAHAKGIVHRDMKPANVFLSRDPDGREQVKVLDFGIAQVAEAEGEAARLTQTGTIVGTPAFISPEQGRGDRTDHRTDIYSVGCILYNVLTGASPFVSNTAMGMITKHLLDKPVPPSQRAPERGLTAALDAVVLKAMAKEPDQRFQTMKEMWSALEASVADDPMEWPDANSGRFVGLGAHRARGAAAPAEPGSRRAPVLVALVVAALGMAAWWTLRPRRTIVLSPRAAVETPAPKEVTIEVRTTPTGASIYEGDRLLGTAPLRLLRARDAPPTTLRATAPSREDATLAVTFDRDREVLLQLAAAPAPSVPAPTAHSTPTRHSEPGRVKKAGKSGDLKDPFSP